MRRQLLVLVLGSALVALSAPRATAGTLYVTNRGSGDLAILDESTLAVRKVIPIGERAWGFAVAPDGKTAHVSYAAGLAIVNLEAGAVAQRVALGGQGMGLAMSPDGATLYLPFQGRALVTIDSAALTVTSHPLAINAHQHGIAISADGRRLYLANNVFGGAGSLSEVDTTTLQELRRIPVGKDHEQVALSADGRRAYLTGGFALGGHDELTVVDLASGAITRPGTGGRRPFGIFRAP